MYASKRAIVAGELRQGDAFPSVRVLSKELKINPNTAAKIVAHLINEGLLESRPGIGTVVAPLPESSRKERSELLGHEIEQIVVEAKRLGIELDEMNDALSRHWKHLMRDGSETDARPKEGDRKNR